MERSDNGRVRGQWLRIGRPSNRSSPTLPRPSKRELPLVSTPQRGEEPRSIAASLNWISGAAILMPLVCADCSQGDEDHPMSHRPL